MQRAGGRRLSRYQFFVLLAVCLISPIFIFFAWGLVLMITADPIDPIQLPASRIFEWTFAINLICFPVLLYLAERARQKTAALPPLFECAICGYDLRATPARCPECGAVPKIFPKRG